MSFVNILFIGAGIISVILGVLLFFGKTPLARKTFHIGNFEMNNELLGFLFFLLGIILLLFYLIPTLGPRLSSPGLS
ncbi:MAG: hypothetical protein K1X63_08185 [Chitinophagales bacterium]|nr:hypothetical protein [Chitinophagales bacterium]